MENTNELENVLENKVTLMIHGREREIKFGFSAWAKIEKEFGGVNHLDRMQKQIEETPFATIPHLIYIGLVDKEGVSEENVLDEYGLGDVKMITEKFTHALYDSLPVDSKKSKTGKKVKVEA